MTYERAFDTPFFAISDGEVSTLYNRDDMTVFTLSGDLKELFSTIGRELRSYIPIKDNEAVTPGAHDVIAASKNTPLSGIMLGGKPNIYKLTINIANTCNLECAYCYADFGRYHGTAGNMTEAQCDAILNGLDRDFGSISKVQFFGGEPLLNIGVLERFCRELSSRHSGIEFYAVSNGTTVNNKILDVLGKYKVGVTVSIDGPEVVNDANRYDHSGRGSYSRIMENIKKLQASSIEFDVECTFNVKHAEHGITVVDLLDFFHDKLDRKTPHISWSFMPGDGVEEDDSYSSDGIFRRNTASFQEQSLRLAVIEREFRRAARYSMDNLRSGNGAALTFVKGVLLDLIAKRPATGYCPAFTSQLSIDVNGNVYPCFMFIGDNRLNCGNIIDGTYDVEKTKQIWINYKNNFFNSQTGVKDWHEHLNSGCVAGDYVATGSFARRPYDEVQKAIIEEVLLGLARMQ